MAFVARVVAGVATLGASEVWRAGAKKLVLDPIEEKKQAAEAAAAKATADSAAEADRKKREDDQALADIDTQNKKTAADKQLAANAANSRRVKQADPFKKQSYGGTILTSPLGLLGPGPGQARSLLGA